MRAIIAGLAALSAAAGCGGGGGGATAPERAMPAAAHEQMLAGLRGNYIWECTLTAEDGRAPWRFALQRQGSGSRAEVVVLEAGQSRARRAGVSKDNAARVYEMPDGSRVLIASDGEMRVGGTGVAHSKDYATGRCNPGAQPA